MHEKSCAFLGMVRIKGSFVKGKFFMKITFFIGRLSGGGAERVVANLASYLYKTHQYDISIVTLGNVDKTYPIEKSIKIYPLQTNEEKKVFLITKLIMLYRLWKYTKKNMSDVYISFLPSCILMSLSLKWLLKGKIICSERCYPKVYGKWQSFALRKLAPLADGWIFQTKEIADCYLINETKKHIIPNAINKNLYNKEHEENMEKYITAVGRLTPQKNFSMLIKAFSHIKDKFLDYQLRIYGQGEQREELIRLIKELNCEKQVKLCGFADDINQKICNASVFVLSSLYEGIPNALLEAMAMGVPCVATDCLGGGAKLLINNEHNGLLIPSNNIDALEKSLVQLLNDREYAVRLGNNAKKIRVDYAESIVYSKWNDVICKIYSMKR